MNEITEFGLRTLLMGVGATLATDMWGQALHAVIKAPPVNYDMVGRWVGYMRRRKMTHESILRAAPIAGEAQLGWLVHYLVGVCLAGLAVAIFGLPWARRPTFLLALLAGLATVVLPLFIMQPCFGIGIAASKHPHGKTVRCRTLIVHVVFGIGLYLSAFVATLLF